MKEAEHKFKLARFAIGGIILGGVTIALIWLVLQNSPTKLETIVNFKELSYQVSCEFASENK